MMNMEVLTTCAGCGEEGIFDDEVFEYDLPIIGPALLCLDCGPEENYDNLRR